MQLRDHYATLAVVQALRVDRDGAFVDVKTMPEGREMTVHVATPYGGPQYGLWWPLRVDDYLAVQVTDGDPNADGVLVGRIWEGSAAPPDLAQNRPDDISLTGERGTGLVAQMTEADIELRTTTSGDIRLESIGSVILRLLGDAGLVQLGSAQATDFLVRGTTYRAAQKTLDDAIRGALNGIPTAAFPTEPLAVAIRAALVAISAALQTFESNADQYLSRRVKTI